MYLFRPREAEGPLQTVLYFPGSTALWLESVDQYGTDHIEMVVRSGRALALPVFQYPVTAFVFVTREIIRCGDISTR